MNSVDLSELFLGLKENELISYTHVLTGYVGNEAFLNKLADIIEELKQKNPDIVYCKCVLFMFKQSVRSNYFVMFYFDSV